MSTQQKIHLPSSPRCAVMPFIFQRIAQRWGVLWILAVSMHLSACGEHQFSAPTQRSMRTKGKIVQNNSEASLVQSQFQIQFNVWQQQVKRSHAMSGGWRSMDQNLKLNTTWILDPQAR